MGYIPLQEVLICWGNEWYGRNQQLRLVCGKNPFAHNQMAKEPLSEHMNVKLDVL